MATTTSTSTLYSGQRSRVIVTEDYTEAINEHAFDFADETRETVGVAHYAVEYYDGEYTVNGGDPARDEDHWFTFADLAAPLFDVRLRTEAATEALRLADEAANLGVPTPATPEHMARGAGHAAGAIAAARTRGQIADAHLVLAAQRDGIGDTYALGTPQHRPEAVDVLVVGAITEDVARRVGVLLARTLYPTRAFGDVLHVEPASGDIPAGSFYVAVEAFGSTLSTVKIGR
jgi:hypothetical protein